MDPTADPMTRMDLVLWHISYGILVMDPTADWMLRIDLLQMVTSVACKA